MIAATERPDADMLRLRTKVCIGCDTRKSWANFTPQEYAPDGSVLRIHSRCRPCRRAYLRAHRARNIEKYREYQRRWKAQAMADPERGPALRAKQRDYDRVYALRRGVAVGSRSKAVRDFCDAEPFAAWLDSLKGTVEFKALAELAGVREKTLREIRARERPRTELELVDKCAIAMGVHIEDIYGD